MAITNDSGQSAPSATTVTTLYEVNTNKKAEFLTFSACNRSSSPTTYRMMISPAGATLADEHYILYERTLKGYASDFLHFHRPLDEGDIVRVYVADATVSFDAGLFVTDK